MAQNVAILGASNKPERYAFKALRLLKQYGHHPFPIHPKLKQIDDYKVIASLTELRESGEVIDTLTMYVGPQISSKLDAEIIALKPKRVIFNPGSENPALYPGLRSAGITVEEACTLVLLQTDQF